MESLTPSVFVGLLFVGYLLYLKRNGGSGGNGLEGFYIVNNSGSRSYKATLTGSEESQVISTGIAEKLVHKTNGSTKFKFECILPETQPTFVYHNAASACKCVNNCDWDSKCGCGEGKNCNSYKAWAIDSNGNDLYLGNLIRFGDGVSRLELHTENAKLADTVAAKVTMDSKESGESLLVIQGDFL